MIPKLLILVNLIFVWPYKRSKFRVMFSICSFSFGYIAQFMSKSALLCFYPGNLVPRVSILPVSSLTFSIVIEARDQTRPGSISISLQGTRLLSSARLSPTALLIAFFWKLIKFEKITCKTTIALMNPLKLLPVATRQIRLFNVNTHFSLIPMHPSDFLVLSTMEDVC